MHEVVTDRETVEVVGRRSRIRFFRVDGSDLWQAEVGLLVRGEWEWDESSAQTTLWTGFRPVEAGEAVIPILDRLWVRDGEWPMMEPVRKVLARIGPGENILGPLEEAVDEAMGWAGIRPRYVDACPACTGVALQEDGHMVRCEACGWLGAREDLLV